MHFFAKIVCIYEKKAVILHRFLEKESIHTTKQGLHRPGFLEFHDFSEHSQARPT